MLQAAKGAHHPLNMPLIVIDTWNLLGALYGMRMQQKPISLAQDISQILCPIMLYANGIFCISVLPAGIKVMPRQHHIPLGLQPFCIEAAFFVLPKMNLQQACINIFALGLRAKA